jgi:hypothetical protein
MRLLIIGALCGQFGAASKIAVERDTALIDAAVEAAFARFAHLPDQPAQPTISES